LLPLVSLTITSIAFLRFKYVENVAKQSVVKGEEVNYSFCINNEDFFSLSLYKGKFLQQRYCICKAVSIKNLFSSSPQQENL